MAFKNKEVVQLRGNFGYGAERESGFTPKQAAAAMRKNMASSNKVRKFFGLKPKTDYSSMVKRYK